MTDRIEMIQTARNVVFRNPYLWQDQERSKSRFVNRCLFDYLNDTIQQSIQKKKLHKLIGHVKYPNQDDVGLINKFAYGQDIKYGIIVPKNEKEFLNGFTVQTAPELKRLEEQSLVQIIRAVSYYKQPEVPLPLSEVGNFKTPTPWRLSLDGERKDRRYNLSVADKFIDEEKNEIVFASITRLGLEVLFPSFNCEKYDLGLLEFLSPFYEAYQKRKEFDIQTISSNQDVNGLENLALERLVDSNYLRDIKRDVSARESYGWSCGESNGQYHSSWMRRTFTDKGIELYQNLAEVYKNNPLLSKLRFTSYRLEPMVWRNGKGEIIED